VHPSGLDVLPRSVKEASLMEKPIIASNVGGIPEIVKNNQTGYVCGIDDVDQWIGKIRFLLDNPDVARRFGKNARESVIETFGWRKIAERFIKILETSED
jgi:glycosyltransferase involved in cell wall biosynthesis